MCSQLFSLLFPGTVLLLYTTSLVLSLFALRVWEKFMEALKAKSASGGVKKMIASWAKGKGLQGNTSLQKGLVEE